MLRNIIAAIIIIFVSALTINNTLEKFDGIKSASIMTPSQRKMRPPSKQNPGQNLIDSHTEKKIESKTDRSWNNNPINRADRNDNYTRNPNLKNK